jgi:hypothetical protein
MMKKTALFIAFGISLSFVGQAQKEVFWLLGADVTIPNSSNSGCNYNVTGVGGVLERGWKHSKRFALIASGGYIHYEGETERKELGSKTFHYYFASVGERFYALKSLYLQGQVGLSSWGPSVSPAVGYQLKHLNVQAAYKFAGAPRTLECYRHPNMEHWGFRISYVLNK